MAEVRVRRDVWRLPIGDTTLTWYARAVGEMRLRPLHDPTSWRYQAAIHEYNRSDDPLASPTDVVPSVAERDRFWNRCQHSSWYFLPWHRMYLLCFERIVADTIVRLGGPPNWSLPYWNYANQEVSTARCLPPAFVSPELPDGSVNPLWIKYRSFKANGGSLVGAPSDADASNALKEPWFTTTTVGATDFGGPKTAFNHEGGRLGSLDIRPHGMMHVAVGGRLGWMSSFNTAALDPIFWLHHANIDRLWTVWKKRDPTHRNPSDPDWQTKRAFDFHDHAGVVRFTPSEVVDTKAGLLGYQYEDETDPLGGEGLQVVVEAEGEELMAEMVGATEQPFALTGKAETARVALNTPSGPAVVNEAAVSGPIYLNIENVTGSSTGDAYEVYLNLPPGADHHDYPELFAGTLPLFGLAEASRGSRGRSGNGLHFALDITQLVARLAAEGAWSPAEVRVTFAPTDTEAAGELPEAAGPPVQVGRVSVYRS